MIMNNKDFLYHHSSLFIKNSEIHGRGVFTNEIILKGTIIEECHYINTNTTDINQIKSLGMYIFGIEEGDKNKYVIPIGFLCSYNSAKNSNPNVHWFFDKEKDAFIVETIMDVEKGSELLGLYLS